MDRATLPHAKSTVSQVLQAIFKVHCYTHRNLSVIGSYVHAEAQTSFGRFVVSIDRGYNTIKHCDKTAKTVLAVLSQLF